MSRIGGSRPHFVQTAAALFLSPREASGQCQERLWPITYLAVAKPLNTALRVPWSKAFNPECVGFIAE
jgi:hypothetical protein